MQNKLGPSYSDNDIKDYVQSTLNNGQIVPGFGHAVLRRPDPRFSALMEFASCKPETAEDPLYQLVEKTSRITVEVLKDHKKVREQIRPLIKSVSISLPVILYKFFHVCFSCSSFFC